MIDLYASELQMTDLYASALQMTDLYASELPYVYRRLDIAMPYNAYL